MTCRFQEYLKTSTGETCSVPACKILCGGICQFIDNNYDLSCSLSAAYKDLQI